MADPDKVAFISQTTLSVDETQTIIERLREKFPKIVGPRTDDICYATTNRQAAVKQMAGHCDLVLVIGSRNSSNSLRLVEVARDYGAESHLIDNECEVREEWLEGKRVVGITSGASAPEELVQRLVAFFRDRGTEDVSEFEVIQEDVRFMLPKKIRQAVADAASSVGARERARRRRAHPDRLRPAPGRLQCDRRAAWTRAGRARRRLEGVTRLILLGDTLELRQGPARDALAAAEPAARALGEAFAGEELVLVPGNHDHALLSAWLEGRAQRADTPPLSLEQRFEPAEASPAAATLAGWLGASRVSMAYPGLWLRDDVYATHGHYLDCHSTLPTFERLAAGAMARLLGPLPAGALGPDDYERLLEPIYAWIGAVAQRASGDGRAAHGSSARTLGMLAGDGRHPLRGRALARLVPAGVGLLNRAGIGPVSPDLSREQVRRSGYERPWHHVVGGSGFKRGMSCSATPTGPARCRGDETGPWLTPGGVSLHNSGNWVYEPGLLARGPQSPFWPGSCLSLATTGRRCCTACWGGARPADMAWASRRPGQPIPAVKHTAWQRTPSETSSSSTPAVWRSCSISA